MPERKPTLCHLIVMLVFLSLALTGLVLGWLWLPEMLILAFRVDGRAELQLPKLYGLIPAFVISSSFSGLFYVTGARRHIAGIVIGMLLFFSMFVLNP